MWFHGWKIPDHVCFKKIKNKKEQKLKEGEKQKKTENRVFWCPFFTKAKVGHRFAC